MHPDDSVVNKDFTPAHDANPESLSGEVVDYDWDDDPDKEVRDGGTDAEPNEAA